ncbi:response regulator transcription factor [Novosphingobium terrae]|uniref:response regulator transcription factor n=1 Tax=Novosphingobium terrae TaxID=2726189 RepID=UPI001F138220|nr:response regulator transcription factor [Novosphingobium terrae]
MTTNANRAKGVFASGSGEKIRILVVDDHELLRDGVVAFVNRQPDMVAVGQATTGTEAIEAYRQLRPDVTLMDLQMPGMSGLDALEAIRAFDPKACVLVLTTFTGDVQATRALRAGAAGYVLKNTLRRELGHAIRGAFQGHRILHPEVAQALALSSDQEELLPREIEVLALAARGKSNKLIAHTLGLSEDTVKARFRSIFNKLDVTDRTHAVTVGFRRGIIDL